MFIIKEIYIKWGRKMQEVLNNSRNKISAASELVKKSYHPECKFQCHLSVRECNFN